MTQTLNVAKRELTCLFFSPIAYVVLGLFALTTSAIFIENFRPGQPATLQPTLELLIWLMSFLVPAISMRLVSEEFRSGTIEPLLTAPVTDTQVIVGKWLGAMGFFIVLLSPLLVLAVTLEITSAPDFGPMLTGLVGLVLVGGLYLAVGTFASVSTENQVIAFILAVSIICIFSVATYFLAQAAFMSAELRQAMYYLNVHQQFENFNRGRIDSSHLVFFVSGTALFLFFAIKLLESRRWR